MSFDWYPFYALDFRKDTLHLTLAQDGAYRRLIDEYMLSGASLPDNDAALARIIGATPDEWMAIAPVVRMFFKSSNGQLIHKRCEQELDAQRMRSARQSASGKLAASVRWKNEREIKNLMRGVYASNATVMRNHATRQSKIEEEAEIHSNGAAASALPSGAPPRELVAKRTLDKGLRPSPSLAASVQARGWVK